MTSSGRRIVAVAPAAERAARTDLFDALEQAFPVRFAGRAPGELAGADAAILIGTAEGPEDRAQGPLGPAGVPRLVALHPEGEPAHEATPFELGRDGRLDPRLRGQRLLDAVAAPPVPVAGGDAVLAERDGNPVWVTRGEGADRCDTVSLAPAELDSGECLRDRLQDGRALALLALVHFIRGVSADIDFDPPPLRATFLVDDPNLHWKSYGHLRYPEIARHADEVGYHVVMAMVPLDGWAAHPAAAHLFREHGDRLSLALHGNDHVLQELARPRGRDEGQALLAQALRRAAAFERRTRVPVARVMTAPHGDCSEQMARDMLLLGFDALCIGRPFPWAAREPHSWLTRPEGASRLAAFGPATPVAGGLPVLLRRPFDLPSGDLALRAFLDQPLVVYGHHDDLEDGLDRFAVWAEQVRAIGPARWTSLGEIAATNHATRVEGGLLRVRMYSRRARVELPEGVDRVRVEPAPGEPLAGAERVVAGAEPARALGDELAVLPGARRLDLRLTRRDALDPASIPAPAWSPWPLARRLAGEGRDRLAPLYRRASRKAARRDLDGLPVASSARATTR